MKKQVILVPLGNGNIKQGTTEIFSSVKAAYRTLEAFGSGHDLVHYTTFLRRLNLDNSYWMFHQGIYQWCRFKLVTDTKPLHGSSSAEDDDEADNFLGDAGS